MSAIPRQHRKTLSPDEVLEVSTRFGIEWRRAGGQIWAIDPMHSDRTRDGGTPISAVEVVRFVWSEYLYQGEPVLRVVQDTRPESEARLGIAYTDVGRRLAAAKRAWRTPSTRP